MYPECVVKLKLYHYSLEETGQSVPESSLRYFLQLRVNLQLFCSVTKSFATLCDPMGCSIPSFPVLHCLRSLLRFMSTDSMMPSNHLILCFPILLLPSTFPSIRVFDNELALCIRWPKFWSFSINPSNEYSGLISFRIDWFDLLAVQGALKSLL